MITKFEKIFIGSLIGIVLFFIAGAVYIEGWREPARAEAQQVKCESFGMKPYTILIETRRKRFCVDDEGRLYVK